MSQEHLTRAGSLLREKRQAMRRSQRELADYLGCDPAMVARMELGETAPGRTLANRMEILLNLPAVLWDDPEDLKAQDDTEAA